MGLSPKSDVKRATLRAHCQKNGNSAKRFEQAIFEPVTFLLVSAFRYLLNVDQPTSKIWKQVENQRFLLWVRQKPGDNAVGMV
jgi:hypothetical protein